MLWVRIDPEITFIHLPYCLSCRHVHELHPLHPFLLIPDNIERSSSDPESVSQGSMSTDDLTQEQSKLTQPTHIFILFISFAPALIHPDVKCAQ